MPTRLYPDHEDGRPYDMGIFQALMFFLIIFIWDHWRTIVGCLITLLALAGEALLFRWEPAKWVVVGSSFAAIALSFVIAALSLENQSRRARTTLELWRDRGGYRIHLILAVIVFVSIIIIAALVESMPSTSVYWPGVVVTLLAVPTAILAIGYLSSGSYLVQR